MQSNHWADRGVLVTGASKGLGRALALALKSAPWAARPTRSPTT
jgi:NAD(P)-dependent dehydrogenase (short-subunit alcohol dehydrogenase family)